METVTPIVIVLVGFALGYVAGKHATECWAYTEIGRLTEKCQRLSREKTDA